MIILPYIGVTITCSSWPASSGYACSGPGTWKVLAEGMDGSMKFSCEALCRKEGVDGCCYLRNRIGCYWRPGGHAYKDESPEGAISIDCSQGIYIREII